MACNDFAGDSLLVRQGADGPQFQPWPTGRISVGERVPIMEQSPACPATVVLKVQIGSAKLSPVFAKAIDIAGTIGR